MNIKPDPADCDLLSKIEVEIQSTKDELDLISVVRASLNNLSVSFAPSTARSIIDRVKKLGPQDSTYTEDQIRKICIDKMKGEKKFSGQHPIELCLYYPDPREKEIIAAIMLDNLSNYESQRLVERFDQLTLQQLSLEQRLRYVEKVLIKVSKSILSSEFEKFGFVKDFQNCHSLEQKLKLAEAIIEKFKDEGKKALEINFDKLGFEVSIRSLPDEKKPQGIVSILQYFSAEVIITSKNYSEFSSSLTLEQRYDLIKKALEEGTVQCVQKIAKNSSTLLKGFSTLQPEQRLEIGMLYAKKGAKMALADNAAALAIVDLNQNDRFNLADSTVQGISHFKFSKYIKNFGFIKDIQECQKIEDRLIMANKIAARGDWAQEGVRANFEQLGIILPKSAPLDDRVNLLVLLMNHGTLWLEDDILESLFSKLGFFDDLAKCDSFEDRLNLTRRLISIDQEFLDILLSHIEMTGFIQDLEKIGNYEEKIKMLDQLAQIDPKFYFTFFPHLDIKEKLSELKLNPQDFMKVCLSLILRGDSAAAGIASLFLNAKDLLEEISVEDRLKLAFSIAEQGWQAARTLSTILTKILPKKFIPSLDINTKIKLCDHISKFAESDKLLNFDTLELSDYLKNISLQEKYDRALRFAAQGELWAARMADNELLKFNDFSLKQKMVLAKTIAFQGKVASQELAKNLRHFKFEISPLLFELYKYLDLSENYALEFIAIAFSPLTSRQLLLESLIHYPENIDLASEVVGDRMQEIGIALDIKNKGIAIVEPKETSTEKFLSGHPELKPLQDLAKQIRETQPTEKKPDERPQLMQWLAYTAAVCNDLDEKRRKAILESGLLNTIFNYHNTEDRFMLVRQLSFLTPSQIREVQSVNTPKGRIGALLVTRLDLAETERTELISLINSNQNFRDTKQLHILLQVLTEAIEMAPFQENQSAEITDSLRQTLLDMKSNQKSKEASKELIKEFHNLLTIRSIFGLDTMKAILLKKREKGLTDRFLSANLSILFAVAGITDLTKRFYATFGKFRNPTAIFTYLGSINKLPPKDKEKVHATFMKYVQSVLEGGFPKSRYEIDEDKPHLKKLTDYKKGSFMDAWKQCPLPQPISVKGQKLAISESDDPNDLLLIGEVQGSCQKVSERSYLNKCLTAYLMNGEIKPIVIKDENGKIVARSLLRVMWDVVNERPVLLQEKVYSNIKEQLITDHLEQYAKTRAKELKIPLVSKDVGDGPAYEGSVVYLGGSSPFIYSDANKGVEDGTKRFTSPGCHLLQL